MQSLKQIYDKKSPLFIVTIAIVIVAIIAKTMPSDFNCFYSLQMQLFQLLIIVLGGVEIIMKTVVIEICNKCCTSSIRTIHGVMVVMLMMANWGLYGWSVYLYLSMRDLSYCVDNQPHHFFLQVYLTLYSLIYVVLLVLIIAVSFEGKTMTVLDHNQNDHNDQQF